ncbi:helix-turn-helix domain-containing protein [Candidatus Binatus sp.]|uniref:helix-turn-helix domain-containing protein n=1 Tax=Candidatus Binatus sp. TaxID=2811406 RepID=UPI003CB6469A
MSETAMPYIELFCPVCLKTRRIPYPIASANPGACVQRVSSICPECPGENPVRRIEGRTFGQVVRERRILLALTHEELARRIKTSTPYVGHLESGKRHPSDKMLTRLSEVLGLDLSEWRKLAVCTT